MADNSCMDIMTVLFAGALALLGTIAGWLLPITWDLIQGHGLWTLERATGHLGRGTYVGGFPIVLGTFCLLLMPALSGMPEARAISIVTLVFAGLGFLRDVTRTSWTVMFPYLIIAATAGAWSGITIGHPVRSIEVVLTLGWPIITILSLKLAELVFGMPALLSLGTGISFLLFFPSQSATSAVAPLVTPLLVITPLIILAAGAAGKRFILGDSGHFALGWLLAGISMIGRSKTLLLLGLLIPSAVLLLPLAFVCLVILGSYLGNELYAADQAHRSRTFAWNLPRQRLVILAGLGFMSLNFAVLLYASQAGFWGFIALGILVVGVMISFVRTFARRVSRDEESPKPGRISLLGLPIDSLSRREALARIDEWIRSGEGFRHLMTADSLAIERARHDESFAGIMRQASLVMPDGAGLLWASDFLGTPLVERIPGVGMVEDLCRLAVDAKQSIYFIGAKPGIIDSAVEFIGKRVPGLIVAGTHHGYFAADSEEETAVIKAILAARPRMLFVAMGVPRQEQFISKLRHVASGMVAIGVGGSFDVISGRLPRAPAWMQKFALEWLFRLYREPGRFWRMIRIPLFVVAVLREKLNRPTESDCIIE